MHKKLLILEDDTAISMAMQDAFEHAGYVVYVANNIECAKQYYDADIAIIDLILFDENGTGNGITFSRWLKDKNPNCWRTIVSAHPDYLQKVMPSDAHHKLSKPIDIGDLVKIVDSYDIEKMALGNDRLDYQVLKEEVLKLKDLFACTERTIDQIKDTNAKLQLTIDLLAPSVKSATEFVSTHKGNEIKFILTIIITLISLYGVQKFF